MKERENGRRKRMEWKEKARKKDKKEEANVCLSLCS